MYFQTQSLKISQDFFSIINNQIEEKVSNQKKELVKKTWLTFQETDVEIPTFLFGLLPTMFLEMTSLTTKKPPFFADAPGQFREYSS